MHEHTNHTHPSIPGQMWKALSQQEKDKYKEGLTPLPASGRGGTHAWARTSTLTEATSTSVDALVIAPAPTAVDALVIAPARPASHPGQASRQKIRSGRVHPPPPETAAPSTTPATTPSAKGSEEGFEPTEAELAAFLEDEEVALEIQSLPNILGCPPTQDISEIIANANVGRQRVLAHSEQEAVKSVPTPPDPLDPEWLTAMFNSIASPEKSAQLESASAPRVTEPDKAAAAKAERKAKMAVEVRL